MAHHDVDDEADHLWADWYAQHLIEDVNRILDAKLTVRELSAWLIEADRRYGAGGDDSPWPEAYAAWILHEFAR